MAAHLDLVIQKMTEVETNLIEVEAEYDAVLVQVGALTEQLAEKDLIIAQKDAEIDALNNTLTNFGTVEQFNQAMQPVVFKSEVLKDKQ